MAIYHLTAKIIKRSDGRNAVAAAAYRAGQRLYETSTGLAHDYRHKPGVAHSEIMTPAGALAWVNDRQTLWNAVEAAETRTDAQVAREIEVGLPVELSESEQVALLRDFVRREFVSRGMVADFSLHVDNPQNPHAHIMLSTRTIHDKGFGAKNRSWNDTATLNRWRLGWAEVSNEHLAEAGLAIRIDHRSYEDQDLELVPGRKLGLSQARRRDKRLPGFLADRVAEQQRIAAANGAQILRDPRIALKALTHSQATFTHRDVARFLHPRTDSAEQFQAAYLKVTTCGESVALGLDEKGQDRYTTREMLGLERDLLAHAGTLAARQRHALTKPRQRAVLSRHHLSEEQRQAVAEVTAAGDLKSLAGVAGSGKSTVLSAMRDAWAAEGYSVKGAALSGIAAENLQVASGIDARTIASYGLAWSRGYDLLGPNDVLVIDEAGMLGTRQLERVLGVAAQARAKVVLVGDPEQLQAIEAGAPFRGIAAAHGVSHLTQVRRQRQDWQRTATQSLARGNTTDALHAYERTGRVVQLEDRVQAQQALIARWAHDAKVLPDETRLVLSFTRRDVHDLNQTIRRLREQTGELADSQAIVTESGMRAVAVNERIRFLRNERALGVKNGSLGTVKGIRDGVLQVALDGAATTLAVIDTKFYRHLDYGYASTVHKAQGSTVDRTYVLATPHFDRHTAYVALSRHREDATVFYGAADFGGRAARSREAANRFGEILSRARPKDLAHDYLERPPAVHEDLETRQQETAERWFAVRPTARPLPPHWRVREGPEDEWLP